MVEEEKKSEFTYILAGDIGATNARFVLKKIENKNMENREVVKNITLVSRVFESFVACLTKTLEEFKGTPAYPEVAVVAIAGPIKGGIATITNVEWEEFEVKKAEEALGFKKLIILNDFEANGYGVLAMKESEYTRIETYNKDAEVQDGAPKALIGAGTGLGECIVTKGKLTKFYDVFPCEGGHTDFPARNELEFGLMRYIQNALKIDRVSIERCCCGLAIPFIFEYLQKSLPHSECVFAEEFKAKMCEIENWEKEIESGKETLTEAEKKELKGKQSENYRVINEEIINFGTAKENQDPLCQQVVTMFLSIYGGECGNLCLKVLPYGGLYLLSGITLRLKQEIMHGSAFKDAFYSKGRMRPLLENIPIFIVDKEIGLLGSEERAIRCLV